MREPYAYVTAEEFKRIVNEELDKMNSNSSSHRYDSIVEWLWLCMLAYNMGIHEEIRSALREWI